MEQARVLRRFSKPIKGIEEALINAVRAGAATVGGRESSADPIQEPSSVSASGAPAESPWRWVALGTTVACAAGGTALLLAAGSEDSIRTGEYADFQNGATYDAVEDAVSTHNTMIIAGWALVGVAAASAAWTGYLFASGPTRVAVAPTDGGALVAIGGGF